MSPTQTRQQLAQRMHELLWRQVGHEIDVRRLLIDARYARDVLLVCDGSASPELRALAIHLRQPDHVLQTPINPPSKRAAEPERRPGHAPQGAEWAADTSGFGLSQPSALPSAPAGPPTPVPERRRDWLKPWRRG